jgi:hypothetical protein
MAKTSSSMKRAEEDRPKGVDMAPSQWLDKIVHENQKYYASFNNESNSQFVLLDFLFRGMTYRRLERSGRVRRRYWMGC